MRTLLFSVLLALLFAGCSNFRFNAMMCDEIRSDPTQQLPKECYNYSEEEAAKASLPPSEQKKSVKEDELEIKRQ